MEIEQKNQAFKDDLHTRFEQIADDFTVVEQRQLKILRDNGKESDKAKSDSAMSGSMSQAAKGEESEIEKESGQSK